MTLALRAIGEDDLADQIAEKYTKVLEKVGFFENISTARQRGLRAKSYTWTASAYLFLKEKV